MTVAGFPDVSIYYQKSESVCCCLRAARTAEAVAAADLCLRTRCMGEGGGGGSAGFAMRVTVV